MEAQKAIKKPIPVEFIRLTAATIRETYTFIRGKEPYSLDSPGYMTVLKWDEYCENLINQGYMPLKTLESGEGTQNANFGDYILKGIDGEFWPVKPDIFERTYDVLPTTPPQEVERETVDIIAILKEHGMADEIAYTPEEIKVFESVIQTALDQQATRSATEIAQHKAEIEALRAENARLKAEVELLK